MGVGIGRRDESGGEEAEPGISGDDLAGAKRVVGIGQRRAIVVDVTEEEAAVPARNLGAIAVKAPIIKGFEEGADLILLVKLETVAVDPEERDCVLVAGFEVDTRRIKPLAAQVQVRATLLAVVRYRHCTCTCTFSLQGKVVSPFLCTPCFCPCLRN